MGLPADQKQFLQRMDELFKTIVPGAISIHFARIDSKEDHPHKSVYDADCIVLRTTQQRSFIREAYCGEFDYSPSNHIGNEVYPTLEFQSVPTSNELMKALWEECPRLWVLVTDMGNGVHHVTSIYRGKAMWPVQEREGSNVAAFKLPDELSIALTKIQQCEGIDKQAWIEFVERYWDCSVFDAAVITKGTIH